MEQGVEVAFAVCSSGLGLVLVLAGGRACMWVWAWLCLWRCGPCSLLELSASIFELLDAGLEGEVDVRRGEGPSWGWS